MNSGTEGSRFKNFKSVVSKLKNSGFKILLPVASRFLNKELEVTGFTNLKTVALGIYSQRLPKLKDSGFKNLKSVASRT